MGEVYLAQDPRLDRTIALKILPTELASDPARIQRFVLEARTASGLKHPNVATIYEIGKSDEIHFIAMEYVEGRTLADKISGHPIPSAEIMDIGAQVADALDEAYRKGITHRDIKPANLMLTSREQVKMLDCGLANVTQPEGQVMGSDISTVMKTETGVVVGTMQYMSPEQVLGKEVDPRTDIFSLGVVLYEMTTGRLPFPGTNTSETMDRILHGQPEAIARFNYDVPNKLFHLVLVVTGRLFHLQASQLRVRALEHRCMPSNSFEDDTGVGMVRWTGTANPPGRNLRSLDRSVRDAEAWRLTGYRRDGVTF